jgi:hypothetical protein
LLYREGVKNVLMIAMAGLMAGSAVEAAPLPGFSLVAETKRFAFYTRGEKVDAAKVEATVTRLEGELGARFDGRAEYYRYGTAQEVAAGTGHYADGVTFAAQGTVHSVESCHDHELVHLVAGRMGNPGAFFQEGLAVALGNKGRWQGKPVDQFARKVDAPVESLIAGFERMESNTAYAVAGSFVGHLVRAHGAKKVAEFFKECPRGTAVPAAFAKVFGQSLAEAGQAWREAL